MPTKGTIRIKEKGQIVPYYPVTSYDSVVNEAGSNLKIHIAELDSFKDTASKKLAGIADNATRTEKSLTNGNIRINGVETVVYTHPSTAGNRHIPEGGSVGQILKWKSDGTAEWAAETNTEYDVATPSRNGLMSSLDKTKLNGIDFNANFYVHPSTAGNKHIPAGGSPGQVLKYSTDGTAEWAAETDTKYSVATQQYDGLMSSKDKSKLDGIEPNANKYTHPSSAGFRHIPSGGSVGQILKYSADGQAKWADEVVYSPASQSFSGLMSAADKKKLDGIADGANNYTHPSSAGFRHIPSGGSVGQILRYSSDGVAKWSEEQNTEYDTATSSTNGLMSSLDKSKLDGIEPNANNYTHPSSAGFRHIPSGGSSGQILQWSADGQAKWVNFQPPTGNADSIGGLTADNIDRVITLSGSQDLDAFRKNGTYYCKSWLNGPLDGDIVDANLIVMNENNESSSNINVSQIIVSTKTTRRWERFYKNGAWTAWGDVVGSYKRLLDYSTDLNNIFEPGIYYAEDSKSPVSGITNLPIETRIAFTVTVESCSRKSIQIFKSLSSDSCIFMRVCESGGAWKQWQEISISNRALNIIPDGSRLGDRGMSTVNDWNSVSYAKQQCNIIFYDDSESRWSGMGVNSKGNIIIRSSSTSLSNDQHTKTLEFADNALKYMGENIHTASVTSTPISNIDLNTLCKRTGVYAGHASANYPPTISNRIYLDVKVSEPNNNVIQTVWSLEDHGCSWTRLMRGGRWTDWVNTSAPIINTSQPSGYSHGQIWIQY